jgi:methylenetetrahydrofolate dehydrogenase (NADP+)/methenyltetrahydrofolate cyclohydrolase
MPTVIDGKAAAASVITNVQAATSQLAQSDALTPGIAVVIVGEDPASQVYVASKGKTAKACGFNSIQHTLPESTSEEELVALVEQLNADPEIHGILVQLPLPSHIDSGRIIQTIAPEKDVDGFHFTNVGKLGTGELDSAFVPCTPAGSMLLIERAHGRDLSGLNAVVVGRSNIVGKPMANLLLNANATVTIAHSRTKDLPALCRTADILVAAVGRPEMIRGEWIKPGATVIDVGINRIPAPEKGEGKSRLVGDVAYDEAAAVAGSITPVPGGVGPMTIALLMANTVVSAHRAANRTPPRF